MADIPDVRASDADRDRILEHLRKHLAEGRLDLEEFEDRSAQAFAAKTVGELRPLLSDLPVLADRPGGPPVRQPMPREARPRPRPARRPGGSVMSSTGFRVHFYIWIVLSIFWLAIWFGVELVNQGDPVPFWPIFPIAGFGMTVGIHAAVRKAINETRTPDQ
ncbi:MAG: DUF1707 domain-containing protein [Acidimicrobiales bacterium]